MFKKLLCLMTLIAVSGLCEISLGVSLKVDVGLCGPKQDGWIPMRGARGTLNNNVGGTNIDVKIVAGADPINGKGGECRCDSGSTHELAAVETTYIKKDARSNARSPRTDISVTLRDLEPGAEYTLYTYHHRWDENEDPITNIIVTGATNVTKPDVILQNADIMNNPAKFVFTAGTGDVVITYQCPDRGQPFFNGFRLYGGSATVQFESASSGALELVTSAKIPVVINDAQADKTYTVDYAVTGGSAKSGDDYKLTSGKLTFAPGSKTEHISLDIVDDDVHEENETIVVELSNVKGPKVALGTPTKHTYTIIDPRPNVLFARASGSGMEKHTPGYVPVTLSAPTRKKVEVDYAVIGGTASGGGVDYTLEAGTVVFEPGETDKNIPVTIVADGDESEAIETITIKLSNAKNALPGKHTVYTHSIVSEPIDLRVDLAVPTCDGKGIYPGLAKPGWTVWAAQSWNDMYMHDGVWLPSKKDPKTFAEGIEGTGVKAFLSTGSEGQLGIGAKGVCRNNLGGGGCPKGTASGDPIANSWAYAVDWAGPYAGDIILLLKDLPAGTYELYSYHNHWEPCKQKNRNCLDCTCGMPPMPSITANPLPAKPDKTLQDLADNILKRYRWNLPLGTGKGVKAIENAYNVAPQHVLSDEELIPSVIKFATDGSEVLVIYQADRTEPLYPDCARKGREGARGILNAFRLVSLDLEPMWDCGEGQRGSDMGVQQDDIFFDEDKVGVEWDGSMWYFDSDPERLFINADGDLEWKDLKGGDSYITRIATQRLSKVGDVAEKSYMFMSDGKHDCEDCLGCPDGCFDDDITCLAGTSDIRVGLYEAVPNPEDDDDRDYRGYNFRFGPNMMAGPTRWVDCTNEVHKTGMFAKTTTRSGTLQSKNSDHITRRTALPILCKLVPNFKKAH